MREPIRDKSRLEHIINAIDTIMERADGMTYASLVADKILFGGIVYYTMIIGEATYKLSKEFVAAHPQTNWQEIADMRHHLVHGYYQVDSTIIWEVIQHNLKPLREEIVRYLLETDWEEWEKQIKVHGITET